jgi:hypothetical protein
MVQDIIWKALCHSASKKYPAFLWSLKVHYCFHTSPQPYPILSQLTSSSPHRSYLHRGNFNIIIPPTPRSSQQHLDFMSPNQNCANNSPFLPAFPMSSSSHFPWYNYPNNIRWRIQGLKFITVQFSPRLVYLILLPNIFLNSLFSKTLSLYSSFKLRDQFSHLYSTTVKTRVL